jgi:hypothetical protein
MRLIGPAVCAAVSAMAALATVMLLGRIWNSCDVGVNNSANSIALLSLYLPGVFIVAALVTVLAYAAVRRAGGSTSLACLSAVVVAVAVGWVAVSLFHGADYPSPICDNNVPVWWPSWIPL